MKPNKINFKIRSKQMNPILKKMSYISKLNQLGYILSNNKLKVIE